MTTEKQNWLEINDPDITSEQLEAVINQRVAVRREQTGYQLLQMPAFSPPAETPFLQTDGRLRELYIHLRTVNQLESPNVAPEFAPSPALRVPVLGRMWRLIRRYAHELVCFYVNRLADHTTRTQHEMIAVLNELASLAEAQQMEIGQLRTELQRKNSEQ